MLDEARLDCLPLIPAADDAVEMMVEQPAGPNSRHRASERATGAQAGAHRIEQEYRHLCSEQDE